MEFKHEREQRVYKPVKEDRRANKTRRILEKIVKISYRLMLVVMVIVLMAVYAVYAICDTVAYGPSPTARNMLVLSALQASATKWVPGLFLDQDTVDEILEKSKVQTVEEVDFDDITPSVPDTDSEGEEPSTPVDEWAGQEDGIICYTTSTGTFKAYIMLIKDPSRVFTATSGKDFATASRGERIFTRAEQIGAIAAINGGEFHDAGGTGSGNTPIGLTFSQGKCVWDDGAKRTFIGFDSENKLICKNSMTKKEAESLGIRDGVSFQMGNVLIETVNGSTVTYSGKDDVGVAQRTAIGQRADGTVIFIVTDGRTTSSLGATRDDVINMMVSCGAVSAGMLDGGSSAMMYYPSYYTKNNIDMSTVDEYQQLGLVNRYKAFTNPRWLPTFFMVSPQE